MCVTRTSHVHCKSRILLNSISSQQTVKYPIAQGVTVAELRIILFHLVVAAPSSRLGDHSVEFQL